MLRRSLAILSLFVSAALVAGLACGQEPEGPPPGEHGRGHGGFSGGPGMFGGQMPPAALLASKQVQEELKLTDEQKDSIKKLAREMRPARGEGRPDREEMQKRAEKFDKKLAEILKPEQMDRFKQIRIQIQGPRAFSNTEVVKALAITDEQQKKVKRHSCGDPEADAGVGSPGPGRNPRRAQGAPRKDAKGHERGRGQVSRIAHRRTAGEIREASRQAVRDRLVGPGAAAPPPQRTTPRSGLIAGPWTVGRWTLVIGPSRSWANRPCCFPVCPRGGVLRDAGRQVGQIGADLRLHVA